MFARALRLQAEEEERINQMQRIKQVSAAEAEQKRQEEEKTARAAAEADEEDAMFERACSALQAEDEQRIKMNRKRSESNVSHPLYPTFLTHFIPCPTLPTSPVDQAPGCGRRTSKGREGCCRPDCCRKSDHGCCWRCENHYECEGAGVTEEKWVPGYCHIAGVRRRGGDAVCEGSEDSAGGRR